MPMLNRCCCTKNLRAGVIAAGVWTLIYCVLSMGMTIESMYSSDDFTASTSDSTEEITQHKDELRVAVMDWMSLSTSFLACFSVILLILGVLKNKSWMLLPWIVIIAVVTLLDAASIINGIMANGFSRLLIAILMMWITITLINIYCELCVLSHYQELKLGRGRLQDYMGDKYRRRYMPEVQHVHIADTPLTASTNHHTVYSFHSQSLYEGEIDQNPDTTEVGVVELRPLTSTSSADANLRKSDSIPIIIKQPGSHSYTGSIEIASVPMVTTPLSGGGTWPRRFRTQSDSAVKEPMIPEDAVGDEMCLSDDTSPLTH